MPDKGSFKLPPGLNRKAVQTISRRKKEPKWMLEYRLKALEIFEKKKILDSPWKPF